jgi:hypothetical protein
MNPGLESGLNTSSNKCELVFRIQSLVLIGNGQDAFNGAHARRKTFDGKRMSLNHSFIVLSIYLLHTLVGSHVESGHRDLPGGNRPFQNPNWGCTCSCGGRSNGEINESFRRYLGGICACQEEGTQNGVPAACSISPVCVVKRMFHR